MAISFLSRNSFKKELKNNKKKIKNAKKIYQKVKSTLDWCDVKKITDEGVYLGKDLQTIVKGIKLLPKNLFLDTIEKQQFFINAVRTSLNNFNFEVYFSFVYIPINFDNAKALIFSQTKENKDNKRILNLLENDEEKINDFKRTNYEVEFHIYVKDKDSKQLERKFISITSEFKKMGLYDKALNKKDYLNYLNYLFENPLINDFYFTRGIFRWLLESKFSSEHQIFESYDEFEDDDMSLTLGLDDDINIRSRFVPTGYNISSSYITVGDKYVSNLLITKLPQRINLAFLSGFISNPIIKCFMSINNVDFNLSNVIKKDYNEKYNEFQKTFDPTKRTNLEKELLSLDEYLKRSISNNDKTFNLTLIFSIFADDLTTLKEVKKELIDTLYSQDIAVFQGLYMQDQLFRIANPFLLETKLPIDVKRNIGIPMSSETIAGLHPYIFETLKDKKGFLFAKDYYNSGAILFDQFYYQNQKSQSGTVGRINGNLALVGKSGSGKTTAMSLIVRNHIRFNNKIIWIDPENKNKKLTKIYGGTYIEYGARENIINVFDLKPVTFLESFSNDNDELSKEELDAMYDTALAIKNVTSDVSHIFNYLFKNYSDEEAAITSYLVPLTYEKVGIKKDELGNYPSFKNLSNADMPTFSDFEKVIDEKFNDYLNNPLKSLELEALKSLKLKVSRITKEWSVYFDGKSTYKDSKILSFGTKMFFDMEDNLKNALTHIIFKKAWGECSKDLAPTVIIVDEAHMFISEIKIAKILSNISRRARKYHSALIIGTQEPKDFADDKVLTEGKAIFNNCAYKLIMLLDQDPALELSKLIRINDSEFETILSFELGGGLFVLGNRKIPISVIATNKELQEIE